MTLNFPTNTSSPYIDPDSGLKYVYNTAVGAWEPAIQPPVIVLDGTDAGGNPQEPDIALEGFIWWDPLTQTLKIYQNGAWVVAGLVFGGTANVVLDPNSNTPPAAAVSEPGDLWWDKVSGQLFILYDDGNSEQWVPATPSFSSSNNSIVVSAPTPPSTASEGDLWFNTNTNELQLYFNSAWTAVQPTVSGVTAVTVSTPLTDTGTASNPSLAINSATNSAEGVIRIATQAEVNAGTSTTAAIVPATLLNSLQAGNYLNDATDTVKGVVELATAAEVVTGTDSTRAITPAALAGAKFDLGIGNPAGTVITYAGTNAPAGYLYCDGSSYDTTVYADLFASVGYVYGGSGSNFNVPDLRGEFIRGWDDGRGLDSGRSFASTVNSQNKEHKHDITDPGHQHTIDTADATVQTTLTLGSDTIADASTTSSTSSETTGITETDLDGGAEAYPRNIALKYFIKT